MLLLTDQATSVLDTKWKLIHQAKATSDDKYDLSQSDFSQLAAYGDKYQQEG
ncbi:MAG: hypothetical protein O7F73_04445 [Gammaproteobacteria bacterium]|nr:hypothetical protein [Gammaproteobacteria bacterium]